MALLRKKTPAAPPEPEKPVLVKPGGKGRATPSRKEAEAARRNRPASRSGDPKVAKQQAREERRQKSQAYREAMLSGDVSRLPPRERAPERVLARDIVDRRRNFGPVFLFLLLLNLVGGFSRSLEVRAALTYLLMLGLLVFIADSVLLIRKVTAAVAERHAGSRVPVKAYSVQRALLPGRFRMPRSRVEVAGWLPKSIRSLGRRS
jgi:hypothetical protein